MLEWIPRGLRKGIVTTRYPRRAEHVPPGFRGRIEPGDAVGADAALEAVCPTRAIRVADGRVAVDRGSCILCGACVAADPDRFRFGDAFETAARRRGALVVGEPPAGLDELRPTLGDRSRTLKRSIHVRHVDAGSDGAEEWEIQALVNPYYDMQRLGLFFTLSPRHADVLLVTGGVTPSMRLPLERAYEVMPEPKAVVAAGTDACSGGFAAATGEASLAAPPREHGLRAGSVRSRGPTTHDGSDDGSEVAGGVDRVLPVDVYVPGSPPSPIALLHGLLLAAGVVTREAAA